MGPEFPGGADGLLRAASDSRGPPIGRKVLLFHGRRPAAHLQRGRRPGRSLERSGRGNVALDFVVGGGTEAGRGNQVRQQRCRGTVRCRIGAGLPFPQQPLRCGTPHLQGRWQRLPASRRHRLHPPECPAPETRGQAGPQADGLTPVHCHAVWRLVGGVEGDGRLQSSV